MFSPGRAPAPNEPDLGAPYARFPQNAWPGLGIATELPLFRGGVLKGASELQGRRGGGLPCKSAGGLNDKAGAAQPPKENSASWKRFKLRGAVLLKGVPRFGCIHPLAFNSWIFSKDAV